MSCCLYILAGADLLLTTARAIIVAQASKNPEILKCWAGSHDSPLVLTVFCLAYSALCSKITIILFVLRSLFALILIVQKWRYPQFVMFTWFMSQLSELSMQMYTCVQQGFWQMDPYALLQFTFKFFIVWTFGNLDDSSKKKNTKKKNGQKDPEDQDLLSEQV